MNDGDLRFHIHWHLIYLENISQSLTKFTGHLSRHIILLSLARKKALGNDDADPKTFFLICDEDDRRVAPTFGEWKADFSEFSSYSRLNMVMLLSSCLETYLRTVISNAFESKPGVIIMCPDSVDGVFLLKNKNGYGNSNDKNYQFSQEIDEICRGDWNKRFSAFEKYFGKLPVSITRKITDLNGLRIARNNIGHYLGRTRVDYSAPLLFFTNRCNAHFAQKDT